VVSPAADRFALVEALAPEIPGAEASRLEIDRGGPSYSVDTAEEILAQAGGQPVELYLVVGADLVPDLGSWHRASDLQGLVTLAIVSRPTGPMLAVPPGWRAKLVSGPQVPVSSSEVRDLLAEDRPVEGMVPEAVIRCIRRRALYAVS
jgi:nicotinate-nucleotide adenylyltransferase